MKFLQNYNIVVHPRCKHTIDELTLYRYKTNPLTGAVLPILSDKKNHVIDSLRYATEQARKNIRTVAVPTYMAKVNASADDEERDHEGAVADPGGGLGEYARREKRRGIPSGW